MIAGAEPKTTGKTCFKCSHLSFAAVTCAIPKRVITLIQLRLCLIPRRLNTTREGADWEELPKAHQSHRPLRVLLPNEAWVRGGLRASLIAQV